MLAELAASGASLAKVRAHRKSHGLIECMMLWSETHSRISLTQQFSSGGVVTEPID